MEATKWWVFDRPVSRDPLFVAALILGVVWIGYVLANADRHRIGPLVVNVLFAIPSAALVVGTFGGSVREFQRARQQRA
jgi:uncharacterized membrane protein (DUF4010 family)